MEFRMPGIRVSYPTNGATAPEVKTVEENKVTYDFNVPIDPRAGRLINPLIERRKIALDMPKGASYLCPCDITSKQERAHFQNIAAWASKQGAGRRYISRTVEGGVRIWRVE